MEDQSNILPGEGLDDKIHMKSLSECINTLTKVGFTTQFQVNENGLESLDTHDIYKPEDIEITNFYRFEGESNPSDNEILYAIKTNKGEQGILTDAYGMYADTRVNDFIRSVDDIEKRDHKKEDDINPGSPGF